MPKSDQWTIINNKYEIFNKYPQHFQFIQRISIYTSLELCGLYSTCHWHWHLSVLQHLGSLILVAICYGCFKIVLKRMVGSAIPVLVLMYSFNFTIIIATWQRLHYCIFAFSFPFSSKWYTYCRPCMWCFINGSTVWLLSWKSREILLSVSFSKLDSILRTFKTTWRAHIHFFCFSGCNLLSQCCNSYEFCVSCCLNPSRVYLHSLFYFTPRFSKVSSICNTFLELMAWWVGLCSLVCWSWHCQWC